SWPARGNKLHRNLFIIHPPSAPGAVGASDEVAHRASILADRKDLSSFLMIDRPAPFALARATLDPAASLERESSLLVAGTAQEESAAHQPFDRSLLTRERQGITPWDSVPLGL